MVTLEVREEFPLRPSWSVRLANWLRRRGDVAGEIGVLSVYYRDPDERVPDAKDMAELFGRLLHALDPEPALVVADRYLRLFGERAHESGHEPVGGSGTSSFRTDGTAHDLQWVIEEFDHEPVSLFFGAEFDRPSAQELHQLAVLLPRSRFLAEPALFEESLVLYHHGRERGDALVDAVRRFAEADGLALVTPDRES